MHISSVFPPVAVPALPGGAGMRAPSAGENPVVDAERTPSAAPVGQSSASARQHPNDRRADAVERRRLAQQEQLIQNEVKSLAARDREVRAHEQAHVAAGGQYAGAATYQFQRGPNGVNYAVGGEVQISTSAEATPEATLRKAQIIRRAALAPAEPSPQDRRVAAMATQMESAARADMAREARAAETQKDEAASTSESADAKGPAETPPSTDSPASPADPAASRQRLERQLSSLLGNATASPGNLLSLHV
jgi:hypothetical protein